MKNISWKRLYVGAILGPAATFFYCVGFFHIVLLTVNHSAAGWFCFLLNSFGIILGGTYHSHWVYLGRIGRLNDEEALREVSAFMHFLNLVSYAFMGAGLIMLCVLIGFGLTRLPRWMFFLSPGFLFLLRAIPKKLPESLRMLIAGGWSNLIYVIYYLAVLIWFLH